METKKIEVCEAFAIDVSCERNDPVDIRCGGPAILGYDFFVSTDENIEEIEKFLEECVKNYKRGFMGISHRKVEDFPVKRLWTKERMEACIKNSAL